MKNQLLVLPGDGIGPEVIQEALRVLDALSLDIEIEKALIGGASIDKYGVPLTDEVLKMALQSKAILLGAVGGPKWDAIDVDKRPEKALLKLRQSLDLFANFRPILLNSALSAASTLKPEFIQDLDILILRELTGGIYFGEPRGIVNKDGQKIGFNTEVYSESEIERIAIVAFEASLKRNKKVCSVDKANVLEVSRLWREVVERVHQSYPGVVLSHLYVDNAAMQLVKTPKQFDVMLTNNLFGDILSDCAAMLTGSIGMLPSASLNSQKVGLYEPVHGSAPDIAGTQKANPLAAILSLALCLRYSFDEEDKALQIEQAVSKTLTDGFRTPDILLASESGDFVLKPVSTTQMGDAVLARL